MADLIIYIQENISYIITTGIALFSLIQSYLNKRKFNQLEKESLVSKVAIEFDYKTETLANSAKKVVKGKITFTNKGTTNIKLVKLNFDLKDRADELRKAFVPNTADEAYSTHSEGIHSIDLLGFNNSKQLLFKNPADKYFQIYRSDSAYISTKKDKLRIMKIKENLENYIENKSNEIKSLFEKFDQNKEAIIDLLIGEILTKELRGFQLFPGESLSQEFVSAYTGSGALILNVEASSLRFLQRTVNKGEEFKTLVDKCVEEKVMSDESIGQFKDLLKSALSPATHDVMDHRKTYLLYLP